MKMPYRVASRGSRFGRKQRRPVQVLASLALILVVAACSSAGGGSDKSTDNTDPIGEPLTKTEFFEFTQQFAGNAITAVQGLAGNKAVSASLGFLSAPALPHAPIELTSESVTLLPRGEWKHVYDEWGWYDWQYVRALSPDSRLKFNQWIDQWNSEHGVYEDVNLNVEIDWKHESTPTRIISDGFDKFELPRVMSGSVSLDSTKILTLEKAELEVVESKVTCSAFDGTSYTSSVIWPTRVAIAGLLGDASYFLRTFKPLKFEMSDEDATTAGHVNLGLGAQKGSLSWDLTVTGDVMEGCYSFSDVQELGLQSISGWAEVELAEQTVRLELDARISPADLATIHIESFDILTDGALSVSISGQLDVNSEDIGSDVTVKFLDEEITLADLMVELRDWEVDGWDGLF